ncbi:hypothetical protein FGO68_gene10664 [Halteria grandinella]|uniref:MPN domain-containing protein n=1 Tax=Halteria grandinella TaxID=5974 RepID=A0A8J8P457_HALGN|nr:hypothetical protein FGO68_gene10664 [Halteria grandinella]
MNLQLLGNLPFTPSLDGDKGANHFSGVGNNLFQQINQRTYIIGNSQQQRALVEKLNDSDLSLLHTFATNKAGLNTADQRIAGGAKTQNRKKSKANHKVKKTSKIVKEMQQQQDKDQSFEPHQNQSSVSDQLQPFPGSDGKQKNAALVNNSSGFKNDRILDLSTDKDQDNEEPIQQQEQSIIEKSDIDSEQEEMGVIRQYQEPDKRIKLSSLDGYAGALSSKTVGQYRQRERVLSSVDQQTTVLQNRRECKQRSRAYSSEQEDQDDQQDDSFDELPREERRLKIAKLTGERLGQKDDGEEFKDEEGEQHSSKVDRPRRTKKMIQKLDTELLSQQFFKSVGQQSHSHIHSKGFSEMGPDGHYQLVSYSNYRTNTAQPYIIYISVEVQIMLNVHSHLSEFEVIGFLGGYCLDSKDSQHKYLLIHSAYPCESMIQDQKERQRNVDLCPESADRARAQIQSKGQQLLGWYHSHPFFPCEPSMIDVRNHAIHQKSFDLEGLPFLALIIGPYSQKNRVESLLRIFHLSGSTSKQDSGKPFNLIYKNLPQAKLKKSFLNKELKNLLAGYKGHKDLINLKARWSTAAGSQSSQNLMLGAQEQQQQLGRSREDKLIEALELMLQRNIIQSKKRSEIVQQIEQGATPEGVIKYQQSQQSSKHRIISGSASNSIADHSYEAGKKDSSFGIDNEERIEKFLSKFQKMLHKYVYGEKDEQQQVSLRSRDLPEVMITRAGGVAHMQLELKDESASPKGDSCSFKQPFPVNQQAPQS